jgi:hypothetical protein
MRRKTSKNLPKLFEAQTLAEAIQILGAHKAPASFNQIVDIAFKIKDESGQVRTNMLREAETNLQKELGLREMIHEEKDTEGDQRVSGESAHADGRKTGDVAPPGEGSHDASAPAQSQSGTSQLESPLAEAVDQVADMGSVDPMNTAVIDYLDDGMSKTEAHNAAGKDTELMEAVFTQQFKKHMLPILKKIQAASHMQSEAIRAVDGKVETGKPGLDLSMSETIQIPASIPQQVPLINRLDEVPLEETRTEIQRKYLSDMYQ